MYGPFYYVHYERGESGCVPIHYVERGLAELGELERIHAVIFTLIQSSGVQYFHGNNKFRTNCVTCTPHAIFALSYLHYNINPHDTYNTLRSRFLAHVHCSGVRETHNSVEECFDLFVFA